HLIQALEQHLPAVRLDGERGGEARTVFHALLLEIDRQAVIAPPSGRLVAARQLGDLPGREPHGQHSVLAAVGVEDIRERGGQDGAEAVFRERPHRVLARRAAPKVRPGEQDARTLGLGPVQLERRIGTAVGPEAPVMEQGGTEAGALHPLQELLRNDLVGVDVGARQRGHGAAVADEGLGHGAASSPSHAHSRTSTSRPATAAAAAIGGLIRWVRPPRPWRPSKLRLEVEAQRSPAWRISAFIPRHIEHPALRHSNPASRNTRSSPSRSAWARTCCDPGTTMARTLDATRRPCTTRAAARRSSIRPLVQEPRNTRSIGSPARGVPGARPIYSRARDTARRSSSVGKSAGSGTAPVTPVTMPGLVPHVTWGGTVAASSVTRRSYVAPGSLWSPRHASTARVHAAPPGARGRPAR